MTLHELNRRLDGFELVTEVYESMKVSEELIPFFNRQQLLRGLDKEGNFLSPTYSEDPYFKTPESAKRYADWKAKIEPHTDKPFDVPNLFINGRFHGSIDVLIGPKDYEVMSDDPNAGSIENKFTDVIYGLNGESKEVYVGEHLEPTLKGRITKRLGFKFG